jgi:hypothetical protein
MIEQWEYLNNMARQRKPDAETSTETQKRRELETIANTANRSDKVSWNRKMDNMVKLLTELKPYEEQILQLILEKNKVMDKVAELRKTMVAECIHPFEQLVHKEKHVYCKFCDRRIVNVNGTPEKDTNA